MSGVIDIERVTDRILTSYDNSRIVNMINNVAVGSLNMANVLARESTNTGLAPIIWFTDTFSPDGHFTRTVVIIPAWTGIPILGLECLVIMSLPYVCIVILVAGLFMRMCCR